MLIRLKELRKPGMYEDLNKCQYYSLVYFIQMSSQRVILFFMLELEWLKGFLQCSPPNLLLSQEFIGALSPRPLLTSHVLQLFFVLPRDIVFCPRVPEVSHHKAS